MQLNCELNQPSKYSKYNNIFLQKILGHYFLITKKLNENVVSMLFLR